MTAYPAAGLRAIVFAAVALGLGEAFSRMGAGILPLWGMRGRDPLARFGAGFLAGLAAFGFALLGLGLTGLFVPGVFLAAGVVLIAASRATWRTPSLAAAAVSRLGGVGGFGVAAAALGLAALVPALLTPEFEVDCELYHLALPWQWLIAHKSLPDHVSYAFHLPLPVDLDWAVALALGDDRIAKWLVAASFVAVGAVWSGRCLGRGEPRAAWAGVLLSLSAAPMVWLAGTCKNDVPAAALFAAGAVLQLGGARGPGMLLLGLGAAAKYSAVPLIAVWVAVHRPPRRLWGWSAATLIVPVSVWFTKSWLLTGNPFYPLAWNVFPAFDWGAANQRAFLDYAATLYDPAAGRLATLPAAVWSTLRRDHLLLLLALPGLLLVGRRRAAGWTLMAGMVLVLAAGRFPRYILPAAWTLCFLAAEAAAGGVLRRRWAGAAVALACLSRIWPAALAGADRRDVLEPGPVVVARHLTARADALASLSAMRPRPARVLNVGEFRSYRFPARVVAGGALGETPVIWEIARASAGPRGLRARFRQLGVRVIVYNCVSVDWLATRYRPFGWDRRSTRLYVDWCRANLEAAAVPPTVDYENGGFYLWRLAARTRVPPVAAIFFAPGTESLLGDNIEYTDLEPDPRRAFDAAMGAYAWMPDVLWVRNRLGHASIQLRDLAGAVRWLEPGVEAGMLDELNLVDYASAETSLGRIAEADRALSEATRRCPSHATFLRIIRANWCAHAARAPLNRSDWAAGARTIERGLATLAEIPPGSGLQYAGTRRDVEVDLTGLLGEVRLMQGRRGEGAALLRRAIALEPAGPWVSRWTKLLAASPGPILP